MTASATRSAHATADRLSRAADRRRACCAVAALLEAPVDRAVTAAEPCRARHLTALAADPPAAGSSGSWTVHGSTMGATRPMLTIGGLGDRLGRRRPPDGPAVHPRLPDVAPPHAPSSLAMDPRLTEPGCSCTATATT